MSELMTWALEQSLQATGKGESFECLSTGFLYYKESRLVILQQMTESQFTATGCSKYCPRRQETQRGSVVDRLTE